MKTLKQHIKEKHLEDFEEDLTGEEMKTFKQHIKEDHSVGTPEVNSVEDGNIGRLTCPPCFRSRLPFRL